MNKQSLDYIHKLEIDNKIFQVQIAHMKKQKPQIFTKSDNNEISLDF